MSKTRDFYKSKYCYYNKEELILYNAVYVHHKIYKSLRSKQFVADFQQFTWRNYGNACKISSIYTQHYRSKLNADNVRIKQTLRLFTSCQSRCAVACIRF